MAPATIVKHNGTLKGDELTPVISNAEQGASFATAMDSGLARAWGGAVMMLVQRLNDHRPGGA